MSDIFSTLSLAKAVLTDARVIGTAIAVFLVMDFAVFVANYTKKPKRKKRRRGGSGFGIGENGIFVRIVQKNDYCRRNHFFRVRMHILTIAYDYTFTSCYTIGYAQLRSIPPMRATESRKIKRTGNRILFSSTGCFFISFTSISTAAQPRRNTS